MIEEIWRPIPSVPGLLASSLGRIMIKESVGNMPRGGTRKYSGKPRLGSWVSISENSGRYIFTFRKKSYRVAPLICEAFHGPATPEAPYCLHRDENSRNNKSSNLFWGTQKENLNHPKFIAYCHGRTGANSPTAKALLKKAA